MKILYLIFFIIIIFTALILFLVKIAMDKEKEIMINGIETDSVVIKVDKINGKYTNYVRYIGNDERYHEAALNISCDLPLRRKVIIKYLPDKYEKVVFVSQEIGSENE